MSKVFKVIVILIIMSFLCINVCFATDFEDVNDEEETSQEEHIPTPISETNGSPVESGEEEFTAQVTRVDALSNLPEANLGLNNILNVILISIGVLLILFAIAILIRLKKTK